VPEPPEGTPPRPARLGQDFDDASLYALWSAVAAHAAATGCTPAGCLPANLMSSCS
jgi:hypothetical protein